MQLSSRWLASGAFGLVFISSMSASAQRTPSQGADELIARGVAAREAGRDDDALALFAEAWQGTRSPRARAQMGLAAQALGRWVEACEYLEESLRTQDPWIARNRAALERAMQTVQQNTGRIELRGGVDGARVFVNDRHVATLPLSAPLRVRAGTAHLRIEREGYLQLVRTVEVRGGGLAREEIELVVATPAERSASRTDAPASAAVVAATTTQRPVERPAPTRRERSGSRGLVVVGAVAVGVGVAAIGAGVGLQLAREDAVREWNDDARCLVGSATRMQTCGPSIERANTLGAAAIGLFVAGGVAAAAGAVMLVVAPRRTEQPRVALSCAPSLDRAGSMGAVCAGQF